jgi:phytoene dehydrogenase-like protein
MTSFDAAVVGSGPNGLAAAAELTRAGMRVHVLEQAPRIGGGTRTEELTLPGFIHDVCSAVHPTALASPFFRDIGLDVPWIHPEVPLAHPLGGGDVVALHRDVDATAEMLGADAGRYRALMAPFLDDVDATIDAVLSPMVIRRSEPAAFARVAAFGGVPAAVLAAGFSEDATKALIGGLAAHSVASLHAPGTAGVGLFLGILAHAVGWPIARGGSVAIADALARIVTESGGTITTGHNVRSPADIDATRMLLDVMPPAALQIAGERMSRPVRRRLASWRPGPGAFKIDFALDAPIPWLDPLSPMAGTVHVGGSFDEIARAEHAVMSGEHPDHPYVLVSQPSLFDPTRAPAGKHTAWAYCHVPNGSTIDMTDRIVRQIDRFAPGFRDTIVASATMNAQQYQLHNPNYVGGDIGGGRFGLRKVLQLGDSRPFRLSDGVFLGSSAVPPGGGVHGMCGYLAARAMLTAG